MLVTMIDQTLNTNVFYSALAHPSSVPLMLGHSLVISGRFDELVECSCRHGTDVIAVQEHRFFHKEKLEYKSMGPYQLVTSSATKTSQNSSFGGIDFLLSAKGLGNRINIEAISLRLMVHDLDLNSKTATICAYSPTNKSPEDEIIQF